MKSSALKTLLVWATIMTAASACRCMLPTIENWYFKASTDRFVKATVLFKLPSGDPRYHLYLFRVDKVYKGCPLIFFLAKTAKSSAACGIRFRRRRNYILPLPAILNPWPTLNSCQVTFLAFLLSHHLYAHIRNVHIWKYRTN